MKIILRWAFAALLFAALGPIAEAQNIFNKFEPATGILKGSSTTYVTQAAVSADVIGLWTGSCSASTFLSGAGACGQISLTAAVTGILPVANGGSGAGTLTGLLKGNGTSAFTIGASTDVISLWTGTCNASSFLRGDGSCASASSSPGGSNTQVQFNNSSAFGGSSNFTWDNTNNALKLGGAGGGILMSLTAEPLNLIGGNGLVDVTSSSIFLGSNGSSGNGGTITLTAGPAATSGSGGGVALNAGNGTGSLQSGGSVSLSAGNPGAGGAGGILSFYTSGGTLRDFIAADGGFVAGSPTGASKGAGSINMQSCFINNVACSTTAGTVTSVTAGTGLTGGTISSTGTIALSTPVAVANGGTGTASPGLVAGTNVTITGSWPNQTVNSTASGGTPAGATTQVQYNNAGAFGANSGFTYNGSGTINVTTDVQIGGVSVCQSNGTNCPTASTTASVTSTGCTGNSAVNGYFAKSGNVATLTISAFACTSNSTLFTFTGFPAAYQPTHQASCAALVVDNTVDGKLGSIVIAASGTISLSVASSSGSSWTASGTKGFNNAITCSYPLN